MATDSQGVLEADRPTADPRAGLPPEWYDRSSLRGDFLVMIPDQTEEDFLRRCPENAFCEFIDGVVYMHAAAKDQHQFDVNSLIFTLIGFSMVHDAGIVFSGPALLRLRTGAYLEPDVFVLPIGTVRREDLTPDPPALLVVEVLSPSTRTYDLKDKAALYREANAAEVWFVDARDKVVVVDRRAGEGRETLRVGSGPIRSTGIPGFWFDVDWLWSEPRANLMRCLDQILAGPPNPNPNPG